MLFLTDAYALLVTPLLALLVPAGPDLSADAGVLIFVTFRFCDL